VRRLRDRAPLRRLLGAREPEETAPEPARVAVVTDSTSCLTAEDAARLGIVVVPLDVAADATRYRDGVDLDGDGLAALLREGRRVTTSQPAPGALVEAYEQAARDGAVEVVSVHLSGELSGTVRAAGLAAQLAPLPVHVVDSRSAGMGLGFAALAAAEAARGGAAGSGRCGGAAAAGDAAAGGGSAARGGTAAPVGSAVPGDAAAPDDATSGGSWVPDGAVVARTAERVGRSTSAWFLVDSLDHLRRGGRLSGAAAALGTVLGLRPVLTLREGRIEVAERVRTRRAARERLVELAVTEVRRRDAAARAAGVGAGAGGARDTATSTGRPGRARRAARGATRTPDGALGAPVGPCASVRVAVQHLGRAEVAEELAARIRAATGLDEADVLVREVGAVLGGHAGPGALAVMITDR
jgi:fatty acid-binding protein DegV